MIQCSYTLSKGVVHTARSRYCCF